MAQNVACLHAWHEVQVQMQVRAADGRGGDLQDDVFLQMMKTPCSQASIRASDVMLGTGMCDNAFPQEGDMIATYDMIGSTYILGYGGLRNLDDLRMQ